MLPSEVPMLTTDSPVRVFPGVWKPLFFKTPFLGWISIPPSFVSLFIFYIFFLPFLGAWCPLSTFRTCFVEFAQRSNVPLMNFCGRKWSPCPIPLPSEDHPHFFNFDFINIWEDLALIWLLAFPPLCSAVPNIWKLDIYFACLQCFHFYLIDFFNSLLYSKCCIIFLLLYNA